ncbi:MAG: DNA gyrase modulator, partial [Candidatus Thorarchaeota archaeon]
MDNHEHVDPHSTVGPQVFLIWRESAPSSAGSFSETSLTVMPHLSKDARAITMEDAARAAIEAALKVGAKFADVRIENTSTTIIEMSDGVTKRSLASRLKGAGIRAFIDGAWAFGQATDLTPRGMRETGESVARLALATRSRVA